MNGQVIGVIGGVGVLLIWSLVIWPAIKRGMGSAVTAAASAAGDAMRPRADSAATLLLAVPKARAILQDHIGAFADDWEKIDLGVRSHVENQMMVLAFTVALLNISIQDVAYDTGAVDRIKLMEGRNGFPKVSVSDEAFRTALNEVWSPFTPGTRLNLDMRYRYVFTAKVASPNEETFFGRLSAYATRTLELQVGYGAAPDRQWLVFLDDLANGRVDKARGFLDRIA